eukprot:snap_masked-scaffold_40-processed-gene-1.22-mRNA-1 protein AED:1.00 eAED:1.00 QI:0/-1/0/0/-1/1/1/0/68
MKKGKNVKKDTENKNMEVSMQYGERKVARGEIFNIYFNNTTNDRAQISGLISQENMKKHLDLFYFDSI